MESSIEVLTAVGSLSETSRQVEDKPRSARVGALPLDVEDCSAACRCWRTERMMESGLRRSLKRAPPWLLLPPDELAGGPRRRFFSDI